LWESLLCKTTIYHRGRRWLCGESSDSPASEEQKKRHALFLEVLLWPLQGQLGAAYAKVAATLFMVQILTCPLLTMQLSQASLEAISASSVWSALLTAYLEGSCRKLPAPPPGFAACESITWLLGNLVVLSLRGDAWKSAQVDTPNREMLTKQSSVLYRLLQLVPHGVLDERSDVAWRSTGDGGAQVAVVIPESLRRQLRLLVCRLQG